LHLLLYLPAGAKGRVPVFLGLNFGGNHTVNADPGILPNEVWGRGPSPARQVPDEKTRGMGEHQWQVEKILTHGYGIATAYYSEIEPDFNGGMKYGVRSVLPNPDGWGALGAWAWGMS